MAAALIMGPACMPLPVEWFVSKKERGTRLERVECCLSDGLPRPCSCFQARTSWSMLVMFRKIWELRSCVEGRMFLWREASKDVMVGMMVGEEERKIERKKRKKTQDIWMEH
jgi:hypothetical protein